MTTSTRFGVEEKFHASCHLDASPSTSSTIVNPLAIDAYASHANASNASNARRRSSGDRSRHTTGRASNDFLSRSSSHSSTEAFVELARASVCNPLALRDGWTEETRARGARANARDRGVGDECLFDLTKECEQHARVVERQREEEGNERNEWEMNAKRASDARSSEARTSALPNTTGIERFDGEFARVRRLGNGRYGSAVWLALSERRNERVAMKTVSLTTLRDDEEFAALFANEIELHREASVGCRHIVCLRSVSLEPNFVSLVQDLGELGDLFAHLTSLPGSKCDERRAAYYCACALSAVSFLHSECGVVFRDVKLENCILFADGSMKLTDFGLAKRLRGLPGERSYSTRGSTHYMAPELIAVGSHSYGVDFWALGVLAHVLLTGTFPFSGANDKEVYESVLAGYDATSMAETSSTARDFVAALLVADESRRLDLAGARAHAFFSAIDFDGLERGTFLIAPGARPLTNAPAR